MTSSIKQGQGPWGQMPILHDNYGPNTNDFCSGVTEIYTTGETLTKNSEYDQEIPQSQTADKQMAPRGRATQQSRDTMLTN